MTISFDASRSSSASSMLCHRFCRRYLPGRFHRAGNVSAVTLLGGDVSSGLWSLLVLVDVDSAAPGLEEGLLKLLPAGSEVSVLGSFGQIAARPGAAVAE